MSCVPKHSLELGVGQIAAVQRMHAMLLEGQLSQLHVNFGVYLRRSSGVSTDSPYTYTDMRKYLQMLHQPTV